MEEIRDSLLKEISSRHVECMQMLEKMNSRLEKVEKMVTQISQQSHHHGGGNNNNNNNNNHHHQNQQQHHGNNNNNNQQHHRNQQQQQQQQQQEQHHSNKPAASVVSSPNEESSSSETQPQQPQQQQQQQQQQAAPSPAPATSSSGATTPLPRLPPIRRGSTSSADSLKGEDNSGVTTPAANPATPVDRESDGKERKIIVGVCAMDKKTRAKPMQQILNRIRQYGFFEIVIFGNQTILELPVEKWPRCDTLIAFFSGGFPLEKGLEYIRIYKPFLINHLAAQKFLLDRRLMYQTLNNAGLQLPNYAIMNRDAGSQDVLVEGDDYIEINGKRLNKPFVEKPVDGEDHNIFIYYPRSAGGGTKKLFRKIENKSSQFFPEENELRKHGSYIYEEFLPTEGTDVKVYTVGPSYAHAEARKSPTVDGRVKRDSKGKEVRTPVLLTPLEKAMGRTICNVFRQFVCGFDLLRAGGVSYVCDVNGWSFIKNSTKYYDDCAYLIAEYILYHFAPTLQMPLAPATLAPSAKITEGLTPVSGAGGALTTRDGGAKEEVVCVLAIIRHGDRTPKQKMKMKITATNTLTAPFVQFFLRHAKNKKKELKCKSAPLLQELLDTTRAILEAENASGRRKSLVDHDHEEVCEKLHQMQAVLERGGYFSGINRKVQLKPLSWTGGVSRAEMTALTPSAKETYASTGSSRTNSLQSVIATPTASSSSSSAVGEEVESLVLVLKWGGELTHAGMKQAFDLGNRFRSSMYPGESLVRLHSTYRHDLKLYSSDEGRVQMTAAAFAKSFLALDGELTPILVSLVSRDHSATNMLDSSLVARDNMELIKKMMQADLTATTQEERVNAGVIPRLSMDGGVGVNAPADPLEKLHSMRALMAQLLQELNALSEAHEAREQAEKEAAVAAALASGSGAGTGGDFDDDGCSCSITSEEDTRLQVAFGVEITNAAAAATSTTPSTSGNVPPPIDVTHSHGAKVATISTPHHHHASAAAAAATTATHTPVGGSGGEISMGSTNANNGNGSSTPNFEMSTDSTDRKRREFIVSEESGKGEGGASCTENGDVDECTASTTPHMHNSNNNNPLQPHHHHHNHPHHHSNNNNNNHNLHLQCIGNNTNSNSMINTNLVSPTGMFFLNYSAVSPSSSIALTPGPFPQPLTPSTHSGTQTFNPLNQQQAPPPASTTTTAGTGTATSSAALARNISGSVAGKKRGGGSVSSVSGMSMLRKESEMFVTTQTGSDPVCGEETLRLMCRRWQTLLRSFYNEKKGTFDCSKIPDIYDCLKYDILHNSSLNLSAPAKLFPIAKELAWYVGSLEHGIDPGQRLEIGVKICEGLLRKIERDLRTASQQNRHETHQVDHSRLEDEHWSKNKDKVIRTRLYFTSESHIATLLNVLRHGGRDGKTGIILDESESMLRKTTEMDYLSHIVVKLIENSNYEVGNPKRHHIELWYSTGAAELRPESSPPNHALPVGKLRRLQTNATLTDFLEYIDRAESEVAVPEPTNIANMSPSRTM